MLDTQKQAWLTAELTETAITPVLDKTHKWTSRHTGQPISELEHIAQSIEDIITTRVGERIMLRAYGSGLHSLVGSGLNARGVAKFSSATAGALKTWEPRISINSVKRSLTAGTINITIQATRVSDGASITLGGALPN